MNNQKALPPHHSLVETADGSYTLFSEAFQEACHSTTGARAETILHYIEGTKVQENILKFSPLVILEVGFGLGVGFLTTLEKLPSDRRWHFVSLELDADLLEWFLKNHQDHYFLKNLQWKDNNILEAENDFIKLTILQGDARKTLPAYLKNHPLKWHAIYQDAFSPKKNPILWTKEWFSLLKDSSHEDVILSTYSASSSIRKSLHLTGWGVQKGERFGPKRTSTRAVLAKATDPEILLQLERSPAQALSDLHINEILLK
ncbi:MAG: MnmC family methyltransferase [Bacteriovoracaceae bacterium]|nr:MnmC family methyltransferase [Bacteriovoracaceae bacterium]